MCWGAPAKRRPHPHIEIRVYRLAANQSNSIVNSDLSNDSKCWCEEESASPNTHTTTLLWKLPVRGAWRRHSLWQWHRPMGWFWGLIAAGCRTNRTAWLKGGPHFAMMLFSREGGLPAWN